MRRIDRIRQRLYTLPQQIRGVMPAWKSGDITFTENDEKTYARFHVTVYPKGIFRQWLGLRSWLPFLTSQTPEFGFKVERTYTQDKSQPYIVSIHEEIPRTMNTQPQVFRPISCHQDVYKGRFRGQTVTRKGHHAYQLGIELGYGPEGFEVLSFNSQDNDVFAMWIAAGVLTLIGGAVGALLTWWLTPCP
jgi:hypothetical protein